MLFHGGRHCFVCDGYDADSGKYHVNWGFNGLYDDYYPLNAMVLPDKTNYNGSKMAVVNIKPLYKLGDANMDGVINIGDIMMVINAVDKGKVTKQTDINSDGKVTKEDADIIVDHIAKGNVL